jgi:hypothetical protein
MLQSSRIHSTPSTSAILVGSGIQEVIMITIRVQVRGGATRVASESLLQDLRSPWVDYIGFIDIACVGALNPAFGLQGYVTKLIFTITALLIDRSLGNSGLRRNNFFVICIEPQHISPTEFWDCIHHPLTYSFYDLEHSYNINRDSLRATAFNKIFFLPIESIFSFQPLIHWMILLIFLKNITSMRSHYSWKSKILIWNSLCINM